MSYLRLQDLPNRGEMKSPEGGENSERKTTSRWRNGDIRPQYPREYKNLFYSKDWNEVQQEEDKWQVPNKWQRISQMVFSDGVL